MPHPGRLGWDAGAVRRQVSASQAEGL
jgi:hypothetical protein